MHVHVHVVRACRGASEGASLGGDAEDAQDACDEGGALLEEEGVDGGIVLEARGGAS